MPKLLMLGVSRRTYGDRRRWWRPRVSGWSSVGWRPGPGGERLKDLRSGGWTTGTTCLCISTGSSSRATMCWRPWAWTRRGTSGSLGIREGASENAAVALPSSRNCSYGALDPTWARLPIGDGSKALRKAVELGVRGACRAQRCRNHKTRNLRVRLPSRCTARARAVMWTARKIRERDGKAMIEQFPSRVEKQHLDAAGSLARG